MLAAFEDITEGASALMDAGELDIYSEVDVSDLGLSVVAACCRLAKGGCCLQA